MLRKRVILSVWETTEQRRLPSDYIGGANPPDIMPFGYERKEGDPMNVTYPDLFQFCIFIVTLVGLCYTIFEGKK